MDNHYLHLQSKPRYFAYYKIIIIIVYIVYCLWVF